MTSPLAPLVLAAALLLVPRGLLPPPPGAEVRGGLRLLWWINRFYCGLLHRLELTAGPAPLPASGPALLIANHTCGIDNFLLQAGCERALGFMIAREWYDQWLCHVFCRRIGCIPVRRDGRDLAATRAALRALEQGRVVPIFPEGRINPHSGRDFLPGKPGAAFIALHARVPVVPAYIRGTPATKDVWKALVTPSGAHVTFGPPLDLGPYIAPGEKVDKERIAAVTELMMAAIRALRDRPAPADRS